MKISQNKIIVILSVFLVVVVLVLIFLLNRASDKNTSVKKNKESVSSQNLEDAQVVTSEKGIDTAPSADTSRDCSNGTPDDYLHPERFINPDGTLKCADGVVIFDHQIAPKFRRTIIPYIEEETGTTIDLHNIDFYLTLPDTGETVVYKDIFYWYEDGKRTIFNTNKLLWEEWSEYIGDNSRYTFNVSMIHEPTGTDVSVIFKDHTTMTLRFDGLE